jgi:hypothetical protein
MLFLGAQYYKEKLYEFNINRECKAIYMGCDKFVEAINDKNLSSARMFLEMIINSCKYIRTTKPPVKYREIHKQMKKICNNLMKLYRDIFSIFIDRVWTKEYEDKLYQDGELLKSQLNQLEISSN